MIAAGIDTQETDNGNVSDKLPAISTTITTPYRSVDHGPKTAWFCGAVAVKQAHITTPPLLYMMFCGWLPPNIVQTFVLSFHKSFPSSRGFFLQLFQTNQASSVILCHDL